MLDISEINDPHNIGNETLRGSALKGPGGRSREFIALIDKQEAGLLSYEDWKEKKLGFIYEIYVLPSFRKQGIGDALLKYEENHALQLDCSVAQISPYALDEEPNTKRLTVWYHKAGYMRSKKTRRIFRKTCCNFE